MLNVNYKAMMLLAAILSISCSSPDTKNAAVVQKTPIPEHQAERLITIAKSKALELGYKVEDMDYTIIKENDVIAVFFYRKSAPGIAAFGGGLSVYLNEKGTILEVRKGY